MTIRHATLAVLGLLATLPASARAPASLSASGDAVLFTLGATGVQVYECRPAASGMLAWAFKEPRATLLRNGQPAGTHGAGPFWTFADGSRVVGRVTARSEAPNATDIPWLRLEILERSGTGLLSPVTHVQRINTRGGMLAGPCIAAGAVAEVPYVADYVMIRAR
jgi:hypothetical protein